MLLFILGYIFIFILIIKALRKRRNPKYISKQGEAKCASILERLPKDKYIIINDVLIKNPYGTSQIDHVVLSIYGIFVIETKNYSGWIYGKDNAEYWTKNIYGNKYQFYNPIKQNYGHIKALKKYLNISSNVSVIGIVAFSNNATLKINSEDNVLNFCHLLNFIKRYNIQCYDFDELKEYEVKLQNATSYTNEESTEHVKEIYRKIEIKDKKIDMGICHRCGGELIIRHGKYGNFYGCSNYPRCKFTKNI